MERFISACRNPLAKSATTKAIGHCDPSAECAAKLLLFSDMAMGCPGLRALLVRIACNQAPVYRGYPGYLGYPTCVFFRKLCYI